MNSNNQFFEHDLRQRLHGRHDSYKVALGSNPNVRPPSGHVDQKYLIPTESQIDEFIENLKVSNNPDMLDTRSSINNPNYQDNFRPSYRQNEYGRQNPSAPGSSHMANMGAREMTTGRPGFDELEGYEQSLRQQQQMRPQDVIYHPYENRQRENEKNRIENQMKLQDFDPRILGKDRRNRRSRSPMGPGRNRSRSPKKMRRRSPEKQRNIEHFDSLQERDQIRKRHLHVDDITPQGKYMTFQDDSEERNAQIEQEKKMQYPGMYYHGTQAFEPPDKRKAVKERLQQIQNQGFGFMESSPLEYNRDRIVAEDRLPKLPAEFENDSTEVRSIGRIKSHRREEENYPTYEHSSQEIKHRQRQMLDIPRGDISRDKLMNEDLRMPLDFQDRFKEIELRQSRESLESSRFGHPSMKDSLLPNENKQWEPKRIPSPPPPPSLKDLKKSSDILLPPSPPRLDMKKDKQQEIPNKPCTKESDIISALLGNKDISLSNLLEAAMETVGSKRHTEDPELKRKIVADCEAKISHLYRHRVIGIGAFMPDPVVCDVNNTDDGDICQFSSKHPFLEFLSERKEQFWYCPDVILPDINLPSKNKNIHNKEKIKSKEKEERGKLKEKESRKFKDKEERKERKSPGRSKSSKKESKRSSRKRSHSKERKKSSKHHDHDSSTERKAQTKSNQLSHDTKKLPLVIDPNHLIYPPNYSHESQNVTYPPTPNYYPVQENTYQQPNYNQINLPNQQWMQGDQNYHMNNYACYESGYMGPPNYPDFVDPNGSSNYVSQESSFGNCPTWPADDIQPHSEIYWEHQQAPLYPPQTYNMSYNPNLIEIKNTSTKCSTPVPTISNSNHKAVKNPNSKTLVELPIVQKSTLLNNRPKTSPHNFPKGTCSNVKSDPYSKVNKLPVIDLTEDPILESSKISYKNVSKNTEKYEAISVRISSNKGMNSGRPEISVNSGRPEISVNSGRPEISVNSGRPEISVISGRPEISVDKTVSKMEMKQLEKVFLYDFQPAINSVDELRDLQDEVNTCFNIKRKIRSGSEGFEGVFTLVNNLLCRVDTKPSGLKCLKIIIPSFCNYKAIKILHKACHEFNHFQLATLTENCFYGIKNPLSDIRYIFKFCDMCSPKSQDTSGTSKRRQRSRSREKSKGKKMLSRDRSKDRNIKQQLTKKSSQYTKSQSDLESKQRRDKHNKDKSRIHNTTSSSRKDNDKHLFREGGSKKHSKDNSPDKKSVSSKNSDFDYLFENENNIIVLDSVQEPEEGYKSQNEEHKELPGAAEWVTLSSVEIKQTEGKTLIEKNSREQDGNKKAASVEKKGLSKIENKSDQIMNEINSKSELDKNNYYNKTLSKLISPNCEYAEKECIESEKTPVEVQEQTNTKLDDIAICGIHNKEKENVLKTPTGTEKIFQLSPAKRKEFYKSQSKDWLNNTPTSEKILQFSATEIEEFFMNQSKHWSNGPTGEKITQLIPPEIEEFFKKQSKHWFTSPTGEKIFQFTQSKIKELFTDHSTISKPDSQQGQTLSMMKVISQAPTFNVEEGNANYIIKTEPNRGPTSSYMIKGLGQAETVDSEEDIVKDISKTEPKRGHTSSVIRGTWQAATEKGQTPSGITEPGKAAAVESKENTAKDVSKTEPEKEQTSYMIKGTGQAATVDFKENITKEINKTGSEMKSEDFKSRVRNIQLLNGELRDIINKLESGGNVEIDFPYIMKGSMLCKKCSIDGNNEAVRIFADSQHIKEICYIVHTMAAVHAPFQKTIAIFKKHFTPFEGIDQIINKVVNNCQTCTSRL